MTAGLQPEDGSWARDMLSFGSGGRERRPAILREGRCVTSDDNGQVTPDKKPRRQHRPMDIAAPRRTLDISAVSRLGRRRNTASVRHSYRKYSISPGKVMIRAPRKANVVSPPINLKNPATALAAARNAVALARSAAAELYIVGNTVDDASCYAVPIRDQQPRALFPASVTSTACRGTRGGGHLESLSAGADLDFPTIKHCSAGETSVQPHGEESSSSETEQEEQHSSAASSSSWEHSSPPSSAPSSIQATTDNNSQPSWRLLGQAPLLPQPFPHHPDGARRTSPSCVVGSMPSPTDEGEFPAWPPQGL
ncbi:hypothetical protein HPB50_009099 [Hyalomma asiaticum]|uniref:Uncharacterized protein n=1 Tax=Hyalomma asiaticum TaxID=266040 RepID=A0ACB7T1X2_HYAAI|nr:hypothetical protein HPB50_009099 [Hyalomma asiaticum]